MRNTGALMAKIIWTPGTPTVPGIYWFDHGRRFDWEKKKDIHPSVIQVSKDGKDIRLFGDYGSGPLYMYYHAKACPDACWAHIAQPDEWTDHTCIKGERARGWVKSPQGYVGFGLLRPGWHDDVGGTIVWLTHPQNGSDTGGWYKSSEGYQFCAIKMPKIKF